MDEADVTGLGNGIWLCQTHAKQIDDDSSRFPSSLLREWRLRAEELASREIGTIYRQDDDRLIPYLRSIAPGRGLHKRIDDFLNDIGAPRIWGEAHYSLARMALYELASNSLSHGGAGSVELDSRTTGVVLRESGERFGLSDLRKKGDGGRAAIIALTDRATGTLDLTYRWKGGVNEWVLVDRVADRGSGAPCAFFIDEANPRSAERDLVDAAADLDGCDEVHIYAPGLFSFSDAAGLARAIQHYLPARHVVVHNVNRFSELGEFIVEKVPHVRLPDRA